MYIYSQNFCKMIEKGFLAMKLKSQLTYVKSRTKIFSDQETTYYVNHCKFKLFLICIFFHSDTFKILPITGKKTEKGQQNYKKNKYKGVTLS